MPLMAVSLLASCGGSKEPVNPLKIDLYKKEFMYDSAWENVEFIVEYEYNDKDLVKRETMTRPDDPSYKQINEYSYDNRENMINYYNVLRYDERTIQHWMRYTYKYDSKNRIIEKIDEASDDNVTWRVLESYKLKYIKNTEIDEHYDSEGSLMSTTTYTYDKKGNLVNEKIIYNPSSDYNVEKVYTVDKNGCTTKIENFYISSSGERTSLTEATDITYLNKLWYRPLKEVITFYDGERISSYTTTEREYDEKNRITTYKSYGENPGGGAPNLYDYCTYEY